MRISPTDTHKGTMFWPFRHMREPGSFGHTQVRAFGTILGVPHPHEILLQGFGHSVLRNDPHVFFFVRAPDESFWPTQSSPSTLCALSSPARRRAPDKMRGRGEKRERERERERDASRCACAFVGRNCRPPPGPPMAAISWNQQEQVLKEGKNIDTHTMHDFPKPTHLLLYLPHLLRGCANLLGEAQNKKPGLA